VHKNQERLRFPADRRNLSDINGAAFLEADMKALNRVGGTLLLLILGIAVISGFQSETGRPIWDSMWNATAATLGYFRDLIGGFDSVAGHGRAAIGWAATGIVVLMLFIKKTITYQQFTFMLLAGAAVAFVLWDPAVLR
jgi:hypothetical protein